jgi:hypothetical protein
MGSNPYPCNKKSPTTDVVGDFLAGVNLMNIWHHLQII